MSRSKPNQSNQQANNSALQSFEQPFWSLVPFPEPRVGTVSAEISKRRNLNSPVKPNSSSGRCRLFTRWRRNATGRRELEGRITGDFSFSFGLLGFCSLGTEPKPLAVGRGAQTLPAVGKQTPAATSAAAGIFPAASAGFEPALAALSRWQQISERPLDFFPVPTDLLVTYTHLPVFNIQVWGFYLLSGTICC